MLVSPPPPPPRESRPSVASEYILSSRWRIIVDRQPSVHGVTCVWTHIHTRGGNSLQLLLVGERLALQFTALSSARARLEQSCGEMTRSELQRFTCFISYAATPRGVPQPGSGPLGHIENKNAGRGEAAVLCASHLNLQREERNLKSYHHHVSV